MNASSEAPTRETLRYKRVAFWDRVSKGAEGECWLWLGGISGTGYGVAVIAGLRIYAHRHAYELLVGPIPGGLTIDHLCENKPCCNPSHMETVARGENARRFYERRAA